MSDSSGSSKSARGRSRTAAACPICGKPVAPREHNPAYPFCQERCRLVDLGRWLGEEYRIPGEPAEPTPDGEGSGPWGGGGPGHDAR